MPISEFLKRIRQGRTERHASMSPTVDIELPLAPTSPGRWRGAPRPMDLSLSAVANLWLAQLPRNVQPRHLADAHPRIVNRLAMCWPEAALAGKVLDELLVDKRGGRKGFASEVTAELLRLDAFLEHRHDATGESAGRNWDRHLQASADR